MLTRRGFMTLGLGAAALLAVGGGAAALSRPVWRQAHFLPAGVAVMTAIGSVVLDGALPAERAERAAALAAWVRRVETALQAMPGTTQAEFAQLVALLAHPWSRAATGLMPDWPDATPAQVAHWLGGLRDSRVSLLQQGYLALHDLSLAAWYGDPGTWKAIGYELPVKV
ncbi:MAG: hypothetical protein KGQ77_05535 [Betaproteobacteria bacterium]|nr:hypothetical protein [Betaproteobacteria bacterium]